MEEKKIEFETAKLAKEKGFNYHQIMRYCSPTKEHIGVRVGRLKENEIICSNWGENNTTLFFHGEAPTQSLLQKWLREVHNIHIQVYVMERWLSNGNGMEVYFEVNLKTTNRLNGLSNVKSNMLLFSSYEEALEIGLQEALKLVKIEENGK